VSHDNTQLYICGKKNIFFFYYSTVMRFFLKSLSRKLKCIQNLQYICVTGRFEIDNIYVRKSEIPILINAIK